MRPVSAKKLTPALGREDWPTPFATDDSAPGWVTTGHFAVYVGPEAAKAFPGKVPYDRFKADAVPLGKLLDDVRAVVPRAGQVTEDPRFTIPVSDGDAGQRVYSRGTKRACVQGAYATLLDGLKVVHLGGKDEPLIGLDEGGNMVAVVMQWDPGSAGPRVAKKRRAAS
jgi:hypothetical protein